MFSPHQEPPRLPSDGVAYSLANCSGANVELCWHWVFEAPQNLDWLGTLVVYVMDWAQEHECNSFVPRGLIGLATEQPDTIARLLVAYVAAACWRID